MRLYVLIKSLKYEIFKLIYDEIKYLSYIRIYEKSIRDIYIFNVLIKFYKHFRYYIYYWLY